ncbi:MAG: adenosylmethionine--8-amino-7-oxononanoate transaminase [Verrucomicrobiales bacterium]|nr:adenosylmethionine--8-amino-7-oxononanoate transaminase [Verrucomicrobiales bacterium]
MTDFARLDQEHVWHPFTQMRDWLRTKPLVIAEGRGSVLVDTEGREYLDANASIWTNLHGHRHPQINRTLREQLDRIAHSSALGLANEPASRLASRLVRAARLPSRRSRAAALQNPSLKWVFFSDDGSTAMEVALKLAYEFARRTRGIRRPRFLSLEGAYHGDTVGAVSLGHIDLFHRTYGGLLFRSDKVMAPYCYRCPFNRAKPERADAREYRQCHWECVDQVAHAVEDRSAKDAVYAGFVYEPLLQGAAGIIPQPPGWLRRVAEIARTAGTPLIADEVMTGFGRTGVGRWTAGRRGLPPLFASHHEGVQPDFLALAKGLTGGYLPMAATLTTQAVFDAFLGEYAEFRTFFHGHSFTANQLGAAAGLASLDLLESHAAAARRAQLEAWLGEELQCLWTLPHVGDIRQVGLVAGIELVRDWRTREPFDLREQAGIRVCQAMARRGVLTRPIGNVVPFLPPYCTTRAQLRRMVTAFADAMAEEVEHA